MATVSHYEMRRYPVGPVDDTNHLANGQYYVAPSSQHTPMYDKSKKTWSQRLKISKADKPSSVLSDISSDYSQSALSRSMKYAEPWLYGTVRGIPARPVHAQALFTPLPAEVAVVVCSCPEYLNGTKKEVKKASICKKCKGSRLPLAPIGGTVCIRSTTAPIFHKARGSAGTVRLPSSSKKSRPTILDSLNDPYDLMRRSRLLSPEPKPVRVNEKTVRNRAKSTSPNRGRSRSRVKSPVQLEDPGGTLRSRSASRSKQECWLDTHEPDPGGRRSILRCDVNPYDLISSSQYNNEFAPNQDDLFDTLQIAEAINRGSQKPVSTNRYNVQEIAGRRISLGESSNQTLTTGNDNFDYKNIESLVNQSDDFKQTQIIKQTQQLKGNEVSKNVKTTINETVSKQETCTQPKRPPRRKHEGTPPDEDSTKSDTKKCVGVPSPSPVLIIESQNLNKKVLNHTPTDPNLSQRNGIKSILKRPSSLTFSISSSSENDIKVDARVETISARKISYDKGTTNANKAIEMKVNEKSGSQFYLPIPQTRKKVQFMVADEIIQDEDNMHQSAQIKVNESSPDRDTPNPNPVQEQILDIIQQQQQNQKTVSSEEMPESSKTINDNQQTQPSSSSLPTLSSSDSVILCVTSSSQDGVASNDNLSNESTNSDSASDGLAEQLEKVKTTSLRRTNSERCANTTTVILNFNDTMALRVKNNRVDCRSVFFEDEQQQNPISIGKTLGKCLSSPSTIDASQSELQPLQEPTQTTMLDSKSSGSENLQGNTKGLSKKGKETTMPSEPLSSVYPDKDGVHIRNHNNLETEGLGTIQDQRDKQEQTQDGIVAPGAEEHQKLDELTLSQHQEHCQQRLNKKLLWHGTGVVMIKNEPYNPPLYNDNKDMEDTLSNLNRDACEGFNSKNDKSLSMTPSDTQNYFSCEEQQKRDKLLQAQKEIYNGARIFGNQGKYAQKTVVRVAPFNKTSPEIHRLKIKHDDGIALEDNIGPKKTSILISGDDCYSTVNVGNDTPLYQSSVVVTDGSRDMQVDNLKMSANTVTINVRTPEEEIIYKNNKINTLLNLNAMTSVIPISGSEPMTGEATSSLKRGRTLITLDYGDETTNQSKDNSVVSHEEELVKILRNPVEAVKRNLVPHVCGKLEDIGSLSESCKDSSEVENKSINKSDNSKINENGEDNDDVSLRAESDTETVVSVRPSDRNSFISKLLEDPTLSHVADGLEGEVVAKLVENSLKRLKKNRHNLDTSGTKDNDGMTKLIDMTLSKVKEERMKIEKEAKKKSDQTTNPPQDDSENQSNRGSISSANSYGSANYEIFDFDNNESDCYQSCSSEMTTDEDTTSTRSKFYQMLVDATLSEIEISATTDDDHHYESIRLNGDPIYEEINEVPPPLPLSPPPDLELEKKNTRSMFEGASKYDILSYLVDAKERGIVREESYEYNFGNTSDVIVEEEIDTVGDLNKKQISDISSRISHLSTTSDSSEDTSLPSSLNIDTNKLLAQRKATSEIERNDSGVGSETSKTSRSKYQNPTCGSVLNKNSPVHLCEDCDGPVETQVTDSGVMYAPLVCRKCGKKRAERKEIITEIVETEEKYGRDLQIILEEFCQPMFVAGLLTQEQLSAIFLNTEELLENNQTLAERMRDALDIAMEQGDDDLLTVNVGKLFLEATPMLHAFESYCVRQAGASLLLANLEKEKELLRIFLRVSQMENSVLRRMNLNSFLMVPVQRVTKYPLLLARLFKVTPAHLDGRDQLKQAQEKIELHLNHMNQEAKDVPTKLWRRISSSSPNRRSSCEIDMINIKLRKMAIDVLEWNHDEVRFALEGKLLFTQPTDSNWKKGRTIKLTPVNALLVTNGKPSVNYKVEKALSEQLNFPKHTGIREASLLLVKEKCGRYTLIREPLYLDRCVVCTEADWDDYFEVQEISSKETFIFKAEDGVRTKQWYAQLQYHAQGMGAWRKRRNALANIMINGMLSRT